MEKEELDIAEAEPIEDPIVDFERLVERCNAILAAVRAASNPNETRVLDRRWNLVEVAALVGRHANRIPQAIETLTADNAWPAWAPDASGQYRYELQHIRALQRHFGTMPFRVRELDETITVAIAAFKGGVGKTSTSLHLAQYLAIRGYRVLLVDLDSQGSSTSAFGYVPDLDVDPEKTLLPFMNGEERTLHYAIRKTHFEGLDLIPSCLRLFDAEWGIVQVMIEEPDRVEEMLDLIREGVATVKADYDVVILDSPPSLGMLTSNLLRSADAVVIPSPPCMFDFSSTTQFFTLCLRLIGSIRKGQGFHFVKLLPTKMHRRAEEENLLALIHQELPSRYLLSPNAVVMESADIGNAAQNYKTILEMRRPPKKTLKMIEQAMGYVELEILKRWKSRPMRNRRRALAAHLKSLNLNENSTPTAPEESQS